MKAFKIIRAAKCMLALPIAMGLQPSQSAGDRISVQQRDSTSVLPSSFDLSQATVSTISSIRLLREEQALSLAEERRFHKLAVREALGTITQLERDEMEKLDSRRTVDKPLPAEAIIARERLFTRIDELVKKLERLES